MSATLDAFNAELATVLNALEASTEPASKSVSDGAKRGQSIIASIEDYGLDMTRAQAQGAVAIVNSRLAAFKTAVNAIDPIDFNSLWPAEAGATISEVIAAENAGE